MSKPLPKHLREKRDRQAVDFQGAFTAPLNQYIQGYNAAYADMLPMVGMLVNSLEDLTTEENYSNYDSSSFFELVKAASLALSAWRKAMEDK